MWRASVLTIFPDMFPGPLGTSLAGKALAAATWALDVVDIRNFATDKHRSVDDTPAGGGPGMVMKPDVLGRGVDATATDARPRLRRRPRLRPLRGRRRAPYRGARPGRGIDRGLRAVGRRDRRHGADRRLRAAPARGHGRRGIERRRELYRRPVGISALYPAAALGRPRHPRGADLGGPQQNRRLAPRRGRAADPRAPARSLGAPFRIAGEAGEAQMTALG